MARSVRSRSRRAPSASTSSPSVARRPAGRAAMRMADPHGLGQRLGQPVQVVALRGTASSTARSRSPRRASRPITPAARAIATPSWSVLAARAAAQRGHLAGRAVGQRPVGPVLVVQGEAAAQLDRVDAEPVQHVLVDDRPVAGSGRRRGSGRLRQAQRVAKLRDRRWPRCPRSDGRRSRSAPGPAAGGSRRPGRVLWSSRLISPNETEASRPTRRVNRPGPPWPRRRRVSAVMPKCS